jgi:hypothetical protein
MHRALVHEFEVCGLDVMTGPLTSASDSGQSPSMRNIGPNSAALLLWTFIVIEGACAEDPTSPNEGVTLGNPETSGDGDGDGDGESDGEGDGDGDGDGDEPELCEPWAQDCPDGQKCVPAAVEEDDVFVINKCVPVLGSGQPGDACSFDGFLEATDDCGADSFCWNSAWVEQLGTVGTCTAFCEGTPAQPECSTGTTCLIDEPGLLNLCVSGCNPISQDCNLEPHDQIGCYWTGEAFACTQTTLDVPLGEPCAYINDCAPGLACVPAESLPSCAGENCCTSFCDTGIEVGECSEVPGTQCTPLYELGMGPFGFDHVGTCQLPG